MTDDAKKPPRDPRKTCEEKLDEAIEQSFPASDPLATNPTTAGGPERSGARRGESHMRQKPTRRR